ncbi:MAG: hypothetical protein WEC59_01685, partial [Salibacteraceae bacterium]
IGLHGSYAAARLSVRGQRFPYQDWTNTQITTRLGLNAISSDNMGIDIFVGLGYKRNTALNHDYRGRTTTVDINEAIGGGGLGNYLVSPFKFSLGFHLTFGLL